MKLLGYARVSTDDQLRNGAQSIERVQPAELKRYAKQNRHTLVDIIRDKGVSASIPVHKRAGGAVLLARLVAREADGVLVTAHDRLFRDGIDALTVAAAIKRRGQKLVSIREPYDIDTRAGWLFFGMQSLLAEYDRGTDVDRATEATHALRRESMAYGPTPFGCLRVDAVIGVDSDGRDVIEKKLYRDPASWMTRERIVCWARSGHSLHGIARDLKALAIPSPSGGVRWHAGTIKNIVSSHNELKHIPICEQKNEAPVSAGANTQDARRAAEETCSTILDKLLKTP